MKNIIIVLFLLFYSSVNAQKLDYNWVIGHDYNPNDDLYGRVRINFNANSPSIEYEEGNVNMNMFVMNVSISDSLGDLLFYSNGCDIADATGTVLPNGEDINPGLYHNSLCDEIGRGYTAGYPGAVILPLPENDSLFYMFHGSVLLIPEMQSAYVDRLLYSIIKVSEFEKTVIVKNVPVVVDSLAVGEMGAVKHANGKDWWIIWPRRNSNQFHIFLFTKDGIVDTMLQTIGPIPPIDKAGDGQTTFSPDGTKMIRYFPYTDIMNFSFDRNSGVFTGFSTFKMTYDNDIAKAGGCAISPNSRYLYVSALLQVYQFDLLAPNISDSQIKVGEWDGFVDPVAITFYVCQLGPDCKIYIEGGGDTRYYHIIHNPDEAGLLCNLEQRGMVFPITSGASIPYFPNYRLGSIETPGLPCSPIVVTSQPVKSKKNIILSPNPSRGDVTVSGLDFFSGNYEFQIFDSFGACLIDKKFTAQLSSYTFSVEKFPPGVYFWAISNVSGEKCNGRLFVMR